MSALWERPDFRRAAGDAWRPGGVELTNRALGWCANSGLLAPGALVLDLGSGAGATLRLLEQRGYRPLGVDKHAGVEPSLGAPSDGWRLARADLERLPLAEACVDCVFCECVLSLLQNPLAALRSACRALRPGGLLVLSDLMLRPGYETPAAAASSGEVCSCSGRTSLPQPTPSCSIPAGIRATQAVPAQNPAQRSSCLAGARPEPAWRGLVEAAGFRLIHYEDNSRALVELAARMVWYGDDATRPAQGCACGGTTPGVHWRAYGYGLWIGLKEML